MQKIVRPEYARGEWRPVHVADRPARPLAVRLLREAGGLGDVVCCLPALEFLHETYQKRGLTARALRTLDPSGEKGLREGDPCELSLYGFGPYRAIWEMSGIPFVWRHQHHNGMSRRQRWTNPAVHYGEDAAEHALSVDLWCPFWLHETARSSGYPVLSRTQIAMECAGASTQGVRQSALRVPDWAEEWADGWLRLQGYGREPLVLVFPLAQGPARIWPSERWAAVARALRARAGARVLVLAPRAHQLGWWAEREPSFQRVSRLGEDQATTWPRLAALILRAELVLGSDSGPYHLSGALHAPTLGLFGMTSGEITSRPYPHARWIQGDGRRRLVLEDPTAVCRAPCYHRWHSGFGGDECKAGCESLLSIDADRVANEALGIIGNRKGQHVA